MFDGKNILVTGGAGFVGSNLILRLLDIGANVRASLHKKNPVIKDDRIQYVWCDLRTSEDCMRVCNDMDYVFMCAANTSGAAVMASTPLVHVTPNITMNSQMLEATYFALVQENIPFSEIIEKYYPDLEIEDIKACVRYATDLTRSEEIHFEIA